MLTNEPRHDSTSTDVTHVVQRIVLRQRTLERLRGFEEVARAEVHQVKDPASHHCHSRKTQLPVPIVSGKYLSSEGAVSRTQVIPIFLKQG